MEADFDEDGDVDSADLARWGDDIGRTGDAAHMQGNGNGDVDGAEFLVWQQQFGLDVASVSATASVPEPAPLVLCALGFVLCYRRECL